MKTLKNYLPQLPLSILIVGSLLMAFGIYLAYAQTSSVIRKNIYIDNIHVGGLTTDEAAMKIQEHLGSLEDPNIRLIIDDTTYTITAPDINLGYKVDVAIAEAWSIGRSHNPFINAIKLAALPITTIPIPLKYTFSTDALRFEIQTVAELVDQPGKDIRLNIDNANVEILTDTKPGYILDQNQVYNEITKTLQKFQNITKNITLKKIDPTISLESADNAKRDAEAILRSPLRLTYQYNTFTRIKNQLGDWIINNRDGNKLLAALDEAAISSYVTTIAEQLNAEPKASEITVVDGKVTDFVAPQTGQELNQLMTVESITNTLNNRRNTDAGDGENSAIELEVAIKKPEVTDKSAAELGIVELIGQASTRFTGSPTNRIANIKNGAKFLTGIIIPPGEEFSTIETLGRIDNTTGYLPELVIKENRTIPEYGGGLCQVSTTLFRTALATGLPITARQNHSYRVSYYEKDAEGSYIGPGLDATIYSPAPDFRFMNDTGSTILIVGHVSGDMITFSFYGTMDGRTAEVDGPYTLSTFPAGDPIEHETDELAPGEKKQIEYAHAGGTASATYQVTYPDGQINEQTFESYYRGWPAQYQVGMDPSEVKTEEELKKEYAE